MHVALLSIQNFRGIRSGSVSFRPHTVLIGPSSCGKTTILEALALVLGRGRQIASLTEHDFYGSDPQPPDRIRIVATITGFEPQDPDDHPDWFRDGRGVPRWLDTKSGRVIPEPTDKDQPLACQIAFAARFDRECLEVETARYFLDDECTDVFAEEGRVNIPPTLIREIGFFLIPATRTWNRMLSFNSELFKRVLASTAAAPSEAVLSERDRLRNPDQPLEDDENIKPVVDEVNAEIKALLGSSNTLQLRLTATDSDSILEAMVPHFVTDENHRVPSKRQGSGLLSLQSLFLLLHFCRKRIQAGESSCMALEEPELHLAPATQRRVLTRLQSLSSQTIVSTHSSLVVGYSDPTSVLVIRNSGGQLQAKPMLDRPLEKSAPNAIRRLFQINRVELANAMLSEIILVPEGRTDYDWMTLLTRVLELHHNSKANCIFGIRIGVIPTSNSAIEPVCNALSKAHPNVCVLVDGDKAGMQYAKKLADSNSGVHTVLSWPDGWMIEDVIGWIIKADESAVMRELKVDLPGAPDNCMGLIEALRDDGHGQYSLKKGDLVSYEIIANAIATHSTCLQRASTVLNAVAQACANEETQHFERSPDGTPPRMVFNPCRQ